MKPARLWPWIAAAVLLTAALLWWTDWQAEPPVANLAAPPDQQRQAALADETRLYMPKTAGSVNDIKTQLAFILRGLPEVASVDEPLSLPLYVAQKRIVHFLDYHFVDKDLLAKVDGRTDWDAFLDEVEATQLDQAAAIECLVLYHGLQRVLIERLTEADMPALPDKVAQLRAAELHQPALKDQLAEARKLAARLPEESARQKKAVALEREISGMLADHRADMLKMGAAVRLLVTGHLKVVLPLDDAELLDAAGPMANGKQDRDAMARRDAAMVKRALASGPVAVIICGGSHDLTAEIRKQDPRADYIRVKTRGYVNATSKGGSPLPAGLLRIRFTAPC
jgi:hypothetical protein